MACRLTCWPAWWPRKAAAIPGPCGVEPGYAWLVGDDPWERLSKPADCSESTEFYLQRCSWGLTQVMGGTARELGWQDWLTRLVEPRPNLDLGARYLALCRRRAGGGLEAALQGYNGGSNPHYADRVMTWAGRMKELAL